MVERFQIGAVFGYAREHLDPLFGVAELAVALAEQYDPAFVAGESVFEGGGAVFEFAQNVVQLGKGLLETKGREIGGIGHRRASRAGEEAVRVVEPPA